MLPVPADMIHRQSSILFGERRLPDVITNETIRITCGSDGSERLAGVNLTPRSDRLDSRCTAHMRTTVGLLSGNRIVEFVNGTGMERDADVQGSGQAFFLP